MKQGEWRNLKVLMEYLRRLVPEDFEPFLPTNGKGKEEDKEEHD